MPCAWRWPQAVSDDGDDGHVVRSALGLQQPAGQLGAELVRTDIRSGRPDGVDEALDPDVHSFGSALDEPVRVDDEQGSRRDVAPRRLPLALDAEQRGAGVEELRGAVGQPQHGRWMAGDGVLEGAGGRVHDEVDHRRVPALTGARRQLVDRGEQGRRIIHELGHGAGGAAELAHRRGGLHAATHDVPDGDRQPSLVEGVEVVPVAAREAGGPGPIVGRPAHAGQLDLGEGEDAALQRVGDVVLDVVALGASERRAGHGDLGPQQLIEDVGGERLGPPEDHHADRPASGDDRVHGHRQDAVGLQAGAQPDREIGCAGGRAGGAQLTEGVVDEESDSRVGRQGRAGGDARRRGPRRAGHRPRWPPLRRAHRTSGSPGAAAPAPHVAGSRPATARSPTPGGPGHRADATSASRRAIRSRS